MANFFETVLTVLKSDERFVAEDGTFLRNAVYEAAMKGDALSCEIFDFTGRIMGMAFADFVAFSAPEAIVLFGGLAQAGDLLMKPIREAMEANLLPCWKGKIKLVPSALKASEAAVLGAAALGWKASSYTALRHSRVQSFSFS